MSVFYIIASVENLVLCFETLNNIFRLDVQIWQFGSLFYNQSILSA